jgi:hypothetical protein
MIGVLGFVICLLIMYRTNHGIRGIQKFEPNFRLLDMRFHYNKEIIKQTFEQIEVGGRMAYQRFLMLDFIFIVFFLMTMISLSDTLRVSSSIKIILYMACILRALFDIFENILLLHMLGQYPVLNSVLATTCSWITTFKFIMLYIWLIALGIQLCL